MTAPRHRLLFLFVDGVGLAEAAPTNPFSTAATPTLCALLGGPMTAERVPAEGHVSAGVVLVGLDAGLGVEGLPQSATGQASLFTGRNAARLLGRHQTGFPGPVVRGLVEEYGLFARALDAGYSTVFANPYTESYLDELARGKRRASVTTVAVQAADLELRDLTDLKAGLAVVWDWCGDYAAERMGLDVPAIDARDAGRHLAEIASAHDLTVHESFLTDLAGHLKRGVEPEVAVQRLDAVLGGIEAKRPEDVTWLLSSDHGNVEDTSSGSHTLNPVPLLAVGPAAHLFADAGSILDVTPLLLEALGTVPD